MNLTKALAHWTLLALLLSLLAACSDDGRPWWCKDMDGKAPSADLNVIGCGKPYKKPEELPYTAWELRFARPRFMEFHIDSAQVIDIDNIWARNAGGGGGSSQGTPDPGEAEGWTNRYGKVPGGSGRRLPGVNLPKEIFVQWKSEVESKSYRATIEFPAWARKEMVKPKEADCGSRTETQYRDMITVGLAPGGRIKVWVQGPCLDAVEVMTLEAEPVPESEVVGPYTPSPEAQEYVEKYGIPYDSW